LLLFVCPHDGRIHKPVGHAVFLSALLLAVPIQASLVQPFMLKAVKGAIHVGLPVFKKYVDLDIG
jgi:hypothetical protein